MKSSLYTCPCCGYRTLGDWPGSYEICRICFWEDDPVQILDPWYAGSANRPSLVEAQQNFVAFGACEQRLKAFVRPVVSTDERDPEWRHVDDRDRPAIRAPRDLAENEWKDLNAWYYWKRNGV